MNSALQQWPSALRRASVLLIACAVASGARADGRPLLTAGAIKPLVIEMAPAIEGRSGQRFDIVADTAGSLVKRALAGEPFEVIIATEAGIQSLERAGKVVPGSSVALARVGIGAAVTLGASAPDISTTAGFRQVLLDAHAIAYIDPAAGGSSGIYLTQLFERMGIASDVKRKAVLVRGGLVAQHLIDGSADLALQQTSELLAVPGIQVLGPIPRELQNYTVYVGAVGSAARDPIAAMVALSMLAGTDARSALMGKAMEPPP